jgi:hypothetical protein
MTTSTLRVTTPARPAAEESADRRARAAALVTAILSRAIVGNGSDLEDRPGHIARLGLELADALLKEFVG